MSHSQPVFRILVLFIFFNNALAQNNCQLPNNRQGQCVPLNECEPYLNAFQNNLLDSIARQFLKTNGLCRIEGKNAIVCCERDATKCITPENKPGACVQLRRCDPLLKYLETKSFDDTTVNYLRRSRCDHPGNQARVCCPVFPHPITGQISSGQIQATTQPPQVTTRRGPKLNFPTPGESEGNCGVQATNIRIIGGNVSTIYDYPWAALLRFGNGEFSCGGSLIHPRYVLTAAHCVTGPQPVALGNVTIVRLGENDIRTERDCDQPNDCNDPPIDMEVEEIIYHPGFSLQNLQNDIALIRLRTPAPYTEFIRPICLQPRNIPTSPINLTVVGWGRTETKYSSDQKLFVRFPLYDTNKCREVYAKSNINIGNGQLCAGGEPDKDSCQGDSGGPLMFAVQQAPFGFLFYQTGIVSFGPKLCGITGNPGVYTKVTEYLQWIEDNTYE